MKVLCDQHQADLLYGMQLLFEDRMGAEFYIPLGYEWFDQGYWAFGREHLGRALADQYLNLDAKHFAVGEDYYVTFDPAHPERPIRGVTLDQFWRMDGWSHIVATVQDNQRGFAALAHGVGAKYVYQVGNTRQEIDWALEPLVIASSEVPMLGPHVIMHQPMADCFRYRDPSEATQVISSFVNLMPRLVDWPLWLGYQSYLPDWPTKLYGDRKSVV